MPSLNSFVELKIEIIDRGKNMKGNLMHTIEEYQEYGDGLFKKLHLATYPIAIKYIKNKDEIPNGALKPSDRGNKMSLCQAFAQSRRMDILVAMTSDDNFCTPSSVMHRWVDLSMDELVESQVRQRWHKDVEIEEKRIENFRKILGNDYIDNPGRYIGFVCCPIHKTPFVPDSIMVYCDGVQFTHIIHALSYESKYDPTSTFDGFAESCIKGALIPFVTQKVQVVIPGSGDRIFAGISDHELGIGLPASLLFYVIDNLFITGKRLNIGFPIRSTVPMGLTERITPGFKYLRKKMDQM
jgi:uncharacterized protein (DUF169 family)